MGKKKKKKNIIHKPNLWNKYRSAISRSGKKLSDKELSEGYKKLKKSKQIEDIKSNPDLLYQFDFDKNAFLTTKRDELLIFPSMTEWWDLQELVETEWLTGGKNISKGGVVDTSTTLSPNDYLVINLTELNQTIDFENFDHVIADRLDDIVNVKVSDFNDFWFSSMKSYLSEFFHNTEMAKKYNISPLPQFSVVKKERNKTEKKQAPKKVKGKKINLWNKYRSAVKKSGLKFSRKEMSEGYAKFKDCCADEAQADPSILLDNFNFKNPSLKQPIDTWTVYIDFSFGDITEDEAPIDEPIKDEPTQIEETEKTDDVEFAKIKAEKEIKLAKIEAEKEVKIREAEMKAKINSYKELLRDKLITFDEYKQALKELD